MDTLKNNQNFDIYGLFVVQNGSNFFTKKQIFWSCFDIWWLNREKLVRNQGKDIGGKQTMKKC